MIRKNEHIKFEQSYVTHILQTDSTMIMVTELDEKYFLMHSTID